MQFTFSTYYVVPDGEEGLEMAHVPESELRDLIEGYNLAQAAVPANCNHPAVSLEAFDLVPDCCVCGTCGAVLKNYSTRAAAALGIQPGWTVLSAKFLALEVYRALRPAIELLDYVSGEVNTDVRPVLEWGNDIYRIAERKALAQAGL